MNTKTDGLSHPRASGQPSEASSASLHRTTQAHTALTTATGRLRRAWPATRIARTSSMAASLTTTSAATTMCACARLSSLVRDLLGYPRKAPKTHLKKKWRPTGLKSQLGASLHICVNCIIELIKSI